MSCFHELQRGIEQRRLEKRKREVEAHCYKVAEEIYTYLEKHPPRSSLKIEFKVPGGQE